MRRKYDKLKVKARAYQHERNHMRKDYAKREKKQQKDKINDRKGREQGTERASRFSSLPPPSSPIPSCTRGGRQRRDL